MIHNLLETGTKIFYTYIKSPQAFNYVDTLVSKACKEASLSIHFCLSFEIFHSYWNMKRMLNETKMNIHSSECFTYVDGVSDSG